MILEIANLKIVADQEGAFEKAFTQAKDLLDGVHGFLGLELHRCVEQTDQYTLLARWERVEDHTEGFRGSPTYEQWRALLHGFFAAPPEVAHYRSILTYKP